MWQASDPRFSASDCLFIYFNYTRGNKGMQNGHWQPCRISLSAKSGRFLSALSLDVFMWGWEFATLKGARARWVSDPRRRGVLKVKKRAKAKEGWTRGREESARGGRGGHPCRVPGILAGSPHLGFRRLLSKRGKEGLFFTWTWENRCFVSRGGGVSWGEWRDAEKRNKAKDPSSQGMGWRGCGVGSPLGLGRCWNEDDLLALVSLVALGHHPSLRSETESHWK